MPCGPNGLVNGKSRGMLALVWGHVSGPPPNPPDIFSSKVYTFDRPGVARAVSQAFIE